MNAWLSQHGAALASAFRRLWSAPLNTLLSLLVMGIVLTLPAFGYVLLDNLRDLGRNISGVQQISLFMSLDASRKEVAEIENQLKQAATGTWRFVPKEEALKHMQANEGMAEIVASLPRNPLPDAFIVEPTNTEPAALEILRKEIAGWPNVAHVQLDSAWVKRFDAFLRIARLALWMLAGIFAAGLIAVTFNTIRLQVMAQAAEIEVARMIGATDTFIRRPFYYFGALQGVLGGLLAAALVVGALRLLAGPAGELAALYGTSFALRLPVPAEVAALAGIGAVLG
ncbi:MAG: ABC transporter permease, partial [Candidatus Dechloromonas phosphoritropha]